ncbi:protein phosphatase 2C domain-containing protein [Streptomyces catenulae]|uniref:Protein phosphatase 2C domain-containing protein n=1 Tax=Streptomyces catenulae TaxID=66875 RepID=A0ABV2YZM1_9ACTN|nr:protein phosphatase 2C domain-containing protein [Streptomyces catenulae]
MAAAPRPAPLPAVGLLPPGLLPPEELPVGLSAADAPPWPFRSGTLPPGLLPPEELPSARPHAGVRTPPAPQPLPDERPPTTEPEAPAEPSPAEPLPAASEPLEPTNPEPAPRDEAQPDAEAAPGSGAAPGSEGASGTGDGPEADDRTVPGDGPEPDSGPEEAPVIADTEPPPPDRTPTADAEPTPPAEAPNPDAEAPPTGGDPEPTAGEPMPLSGAPEPTTGEPTPLPDEATPTPGALEPADTPGDPAVQDAEPERPEPLAATRRTEATRETEAATDPEPEPTTEATGETEATRETEAAPAPAPVQPPEAAQPPQPPLPAFIGDRPPTYAAEPVALPVAEPGAMGEVVPDTVLDGAQYGSLTVRAVSQRGDSARYRGAPRRDALLLARFGSGAQTLILAAVASGPAVGDPRAAHDVCAWIGGAVARSCTRLAEDLRTDHRSALRSGLQRLADRGYGKLRERTAGSDGVPESPAAVRCLLLPADPACRTRVFFGVGEGGFLRLRDGSWEDLEPSATGPGADADGSPRPAPFLFTTVTGRRGDALLLCSAGLAEPLADEPALADRLAADLSGPPPGLTSFLTSAQVRVKGHARDRTAVGVWDT